MVTRFNPRTAAVFAGAALSLTLVCTTAMAQQEGPIIVTGPTANLHIERVSFHDLNLATRDGEMTLYRRVSNAVERVCLKDEGRWYGMTQPGFISCTEGAWRGARPQMTGAIFRARQLAYNRRR